MKKIFILILLFASAKAQQKDTINNATITVGNTTYSNVVIIIPHQSSVSGVNSVNGRSGNVLLSKNDVGLPLVENISISAAVQNATNNLQALINQKQNTLNSSNAGNNIQINNGVISATGGSSDNQVVSLPETTWWKILRATTTDSIYNNGTQQSSYSYGGYRTNRNVNFSTNRPDIVYTIGSYNIDIPNGGRKTLKDYAWDMSIETWFDNAGYIGKPGDAEAHLFRQYTIDNGEVRHFSGYFNNWNGTGRWDMGTNSLTFNYPNIKDALGNPFMWGSLTSAQLSLMPAAGGGSAVYLFNVGQTNKITLSNIGSVPVLDMPNAFHVDAYGNMDAKALKIYVDEAAAKADGRTKGQWYMCNGFIRYVQ